MEFLGQKTTWAGIALIVIGAVAMATGDIDGGSARVAEGFGLIFLRQSFNKGIKR